jgi:hypothetical protein
MKLVLQMVDISEGHIPFAFQVHSVLIKLQLNTVKSRHGKVFSFLYIFFTNRTGTFVFNRGIWI